MPRWLLHYGRHGQRPAAWQSFTLPDLLLNAVADGRLTMQQAREIESVEAVYVVAADAQQRAEIEAQWLKGIRNARYFNVDAALVRRDAVANGRCPAGFTIKRRRVISLDDGGLPQICIAATNVSRRRRRHWLARVA